jgi:arylsulfatase A-like enzyme
MTTAVNNYNLKSFLKNSLRISFLVGVTMGVVEAIIISARVLLSNDWNLALFANLIKFISLAAAMGVGIVIIGEMLFALVLHLVHRLWPKITLANMSKWALRFGWFWAIAFLLGVWVNYNTTDRYPLSTESLLYDGAAMVAALILAFIAAAVTKRWAVSAESSSSRKHLKLGLAWLTLLALALTQGMIASSTTKSGKTNVVLLIVDTLRADRLGCYGYEKPTSPSIDAIAKQGVLFEQTYVQWASSLPSHASIMTSTYPHVHGAFPNGKHLNPELPTLAKILKAQGYTNGAFVSNSLVGNQYNFHLGFDTFIDQAAFDYRNTTLAAWIHSLNAVRAIDHLTHNDLFTTLAVSWIGVHQSEPLFLWMQWLYPHAPYRPPAKFLEPVAKPYSGIANGTMAQIELINKKKLTLSPEDEERYSALYDGEVLCSDYQIGRIVDKLRSLNLLDNTLLIISADHGENLNEHGMEYGHYGVYDSSVRIPLIFAKPHELPAGKRVSQVVQSLEVAPTILDLLEIPRPPQFQGRSLRPLIFEDNLEWESVAHSVMFRDNVNFLALRSGEWKINLKVRDGQNTYELYHITTDPNELNNRFETETMIADSLQNVLSQWIESNFQPADLVYAPGTYFKEDFDKATIERLRALGYIK